MNTVRVLIVDDEKPGRERVRRLVSRDARLELAGVSGGGAEALEMVDDAVEAGRPVQLMFLDVQMPEVDGFAVVSTLVRRSRPETASRWPPGTASAGTRGSCACRPA